MHSKTNIKKLTPIFICNNPICSSILGLLIAGPAAADIDETYHLSFGANIASYDSSLSISSADSSLNKAIDLEDDMGYDSQANTGWISGWYRVGDLHRLKLTYTPIERSASVRSSKDISINNTIIKSGAALESDARSDVLDFSYIYSFYKKPQLEMGLSVGIYWLLNDTIIQAAGQIQAEGEDQPAFRSDYFTEEKLLAPMPLIGFSANYEISPPWRLQASLRYLSVQIGDTDGRIFSTEIGTEYYFTDNWGIGASISSFDLTVEAKSIISNTLLNWDHNGIQIYAVFKY